MLWLWLPDSFEHCEGIACISVKSEHECRKRAGDQKNEPSATEG